MEHSEERVMGPYQDGEDQSGAPSSGPTSVQDAVEALRRSEFEPLSPPAPGPEPDRPRGPALSRWQVQLLIGVLTALLVWPLAAWDPGDEPIRATVAGETLERSAPATVPASDASSTTTVAAAEVSTTTITTTAPIVSAPPTTASPPPPSTTTTSTTTTTVPKPPKAIRPQSASEVFPGLQLTLTASPPGSGEARMAEFELAAEFGDIRLLRSARFEFGDGTGADVAVRPWACWDPAAPNPYVLSGPAHTYAAPGSYAVTVTVRTAVCALGQGEPVSEDTAQLRLVLTVP